MLVLSLDSRTNAKLAKQILDESDIELISAETIDEAAKKAVGLVS